MSAIYVCPLSRLAATIQQSGARSVVTLINRDTPVHLPPVIRAADHLFLDVHDITEPSEGLTLCAEEHVARFLRFMHDWDHRAPVIVHCWAGISRSTATAFSAYCALRPDQDEAEIAARLRERSPEATPNGRIVALADAMLRRQGRMVAAIEAIGRGAESAEGSVFSLGLDE